MSEQYQQEISSESSEFSFSERVVGFSRLMLVKELDTADCFRIQTVLNSYLGFAKGKRTYNRRKQLLQMLPPEFYKVP